jgi:hypothetical protein
MPPKNFKPAAALVEANKLEKRWTVCFRVTFKQKYLVIGYLTDIHNFDFLLI